VHGHPAEFVGNAVHESRFAAPGDPTVLKLLEHERLIRVMASSALTTEELNALLALLEQCGSPVRERQSQEEKGISLRLDCD
jgi:hypothetical protein